MFAEGAENNHVDERTQGKSHHLQEAAKTLVMDKAIEFPADFPGGEGGKKVVNRAKRSRIRIVGEKDGHTEYSIESGEGLGVGKGSIRNIW